MPQVPGRALGLQFDSWSFWLVLWPATVAALWAVRGRLLMRNLVLLGASYSFYAAWDVRFLALLLVSSLVDYSLARLIEGRPWHRRRFVLLSIVVNLGILFTFKYYSFFLVELRALLGLSPAPNLLIDVGVPVGLSFYTFQTLGYTIDVARGKLKAEASLLRYCCFVSFFPQLMAGPIERGRDLLPQFSTLRLPQGKELERYSWWIVWGIFLKSFVARGCSSFVDPCFSDPSRCDATALVAAQGFFVVQLYADFAGYSAMAIGLAGLLGFRLSENFNSPLLARSVVEFLKRWHLTLTRWLRDYVFYYVHRRFGRGPWALLFATLVYLALIGFWHGPQLGYVLCFAIGIVHFVPRIFFGLRNADERVPLRWLDAPKVLVTFCFLALHLTLFRAGTLDRAHDFFVELVSASWSAPSVDVVVFGLFCAGLLLLERWVRSWRGLPSRLPARLAVRLVSLAMVYVAAAGFYRPQPNIYFQF